MVWICQGCNFGNVDFQKKCVHCGKLKPEENDILDK